VSDTEQAEAAGVPAIRAVAALEDDLRRGMYAFCRRSRRPVTRDEAAAQVGISRKLAAFHLDKLVDAGLLRARYQAVAGAPRVGRRPKVYEPTDDDIHIAIPDRRPDLLAAILIDTVLDHDVPEPAADTALRVAHRWGTESGAQERDRARPGRLGPERALTLAEKELARLGYEPDRESPTQLRLRNCPFRPLAGRAPELVCGVNHAFIAGFLAGLDAPGVRALLEPADGECCVRLRSVTDPPEPPG
jgi:predicted ArsR family transcriptional regulator